MITYSIDWKKHDQQHKEAVEEYTRIIECALDSKQEEIEAEIRRNMVELVTYGACVISPTGVSIKDVYLLDRDAKLTNN